MFDKKLQLKANLDNSWFVVTQPTHEKKKRLHLIFSTPPHNCAVENVLFDDIKKTYQTTDKLLGHQTTNQHFSLG